MNTSEIMRNAHKIARECRDCFDSYKDALAVGLSLAWKIAKCEVGSIETAIEIVVCDYGTEEFINRLVGNVA